MPRYVPSSTVRGQEGSGLRELEQAEDLGYVTGSQPDRLRDGFGAQRGVDQLDAGDRADGLPAVGRGQDAGERGDPAGADQPAQVGPRLRVGRVREGRGPGGVVQDMQKCGGHRLVRVLVLVRALGPVPVPGPARVLMLWGLRPWCGPGPGGFRSW